MVQCTFATCWKHCLEMAFDGTLRKTDRANILRKGEYPDARDDERRWGERLRCIRCTGVRFTLEGRSDFLPGRSKQSLVSGPVIGSRCRVESAVLSLVSSGHVICPWLLVVPMRGREMERYKDLGEITT